MARAPRGRPPGGCKWETAIGWVDAITGKPRDADRAREKAAGARRAYDRKRYWDPKTKARKRRLQRSARERGRPPRPMQLRLDDMLSGRADAGRSDGSEQAQGDEHRDATCVQTHGESVRPQVNDLTDSWTSTSSPRPHALLTPSTPTRSSPIPDAGAAQHYQQDT